MDQTHALAAGATAVLVALIVAVAGLWLRVGGLQRRLGGLMVGGVPPSLPELLSEYGARMAALQEDLRTLEARHTATAKMAAGALQNVGFVKFNAFDGVGGNLSFSLALLDGNGDGVVLTNLVGSQDSRVYAKLVRAGKSSHPLSPEEARAISWAIRPGDGS